MRTLIEVLADWALLVAAIAAIAASIVALDYVRQALTLAEVMAVGALVTGCVAMALSMVRLVACREVPRKEEE